MKHKILHSALALLVLSLLVAAPRAQQPATPSDDRIALYQALLDLQNPWTVMCVAAHPDDEDGTSLIVMRRKYGAHTVSLFSTFGEGGQNAIARVNPADHKVTLFKLPESSGYANLNTAVFDRNGIYWFTGQSGIYGRLDPKSVMVLIALELQIFYF